MIYTREYRTPANIAKHLFFVIIVQTLRIFLFIRAFFANENMESIAQQFLGNNGNLKIVKIIRRKK